MRERCGIVFAAAERDETPHFRLVLDRLDDAVERVAAVTRRRYPDLAVPYHSRWRHFSAGGVDRAALVAPGASVAEIARARIDLAAVSVLLYAGAGPGWCFREAETGDLNHHSPQTIGRFLRALSHEHRLTMLVDLVPLWGELGAEDVMMETLLEVTGVQR